jgi:hypothetical protein
MHLTINFIGHTDLIVGVEKPLLKDYRDDGAVHRKIVEDIQHTTMNLLLVRIALTERVQ